MTVCANFINAVREQWRQTRGVILDCDGVIIDSIEANAAYYNLFRARFDLPPLSDDEKRFVHSATVAGSLDHILPAELRAEAEEFRRILDYERVLPALALEPGLREILETLRDADLRLAVNTNRINTMDLIIDRFGLHGFFEPVMQAGDVTLPKPHPEGVVRILTAWGHEPHEVVFVGDSHVDEATAKAAGVPFWAYRNPELNAQAHVSGFAELRSCIATLKAESGA